MNASASRPAFGEPCCLRHATWHPISSMRQQRLSMRLPRAVSTKKPALQLSSKEEELRRKLANYVYTAPAEPGSTLVIRPLKPERAQQCCDLLTEAFVTSEPGRMEAYKRFLRRQISEYLQRHMNLLPHTMVLTAALSPSAPEGPDGPSVPEGSDGPEGPAVPEEADGHHARGGSAMAARAAADGADAGAGAQGPGAGVGAEARLAADSSSTGAALAEERGTADAGPGLGASSSLSSQSASSGPSFSSSPGTAALARSRMSASRNPSPLLGSAEISFTASTRSRYWTLNSPPEAAYLCNMAVAPQFRRKGVAMHLIRAIEEVCAMAGQNQIYLHLRLQDGPAGELYRRAGFRPVDEDCFLVSLFGLDRRYLMLKELDGVHARSIDL